METKEIKRKSVSGVISYSLRTGALYVIAIVATGLLSVFLSPEDFGVYFVVSAVIGIFTFMSDVGLAATLVQKKMEPSIEELRTTFTVQQLLALVIVVSSFLLTPIWKSQTNLSSDGLILLYALSISFVLASWKTIPSILLERKMEFTKIVYPQIAETLIFYAVAVYLASLGWGVRSYTIAVLARSIVGVIVIYAIQRWPIGLSFSRKTAKAMLGYGVKFQINDMLARIKDDLFIAVLAKFLPTYQMGLIGWAKKWSMFPYQFSVNSVVAIAFPTFSRIQDDKELLKKALEKSLFFISLLIFPIIAGIIIVSLPLTQLIPQYTKWQPALPSLYFFCINIMFAALANPLINTLNAIGKINKTLILMLIMTLSTWILTPVMIHFFGVNGVSMASAIVAAISLFVLVEVKKIVAVNFWDNIWRQGLAALMMIISLYLSKQYWDQSWIGLLTAIFAGGFVYTLTIILVGFKKTKSEIDTLFKR